MNLTMLLAEWIAAWNSKEIEPRAKVEACRHMTDTLACIIYGMGEDTPRKILTYLKEKDGNRGNPLIGETGIRASSEDCAFYYGVCAHTCDFDDLSKNFGGHPGAVILPVVLALSEEKMPDPDLFLRGFVAGVETAAVVGAALAGTGMNKGWNPTSVFGIFGAVAAGAVILKMEPSKIRIALGIAAGEASGLKVNYGSAAKDLTVGYTAAKAVFALKMAELGLGAARDAMGAENGLFSVLASDFKRSKFEMLLQTGQSDFLNPGIILKPYPACRGVHNGIDGALQLVEEYGITHEKVKRIICKVQDTVLEANRYPNPENGVEGKFSLPYCVAVAIINRQVVPEDFTEHTVITEKIRGLIGKIEILVDPSFTDAKSGIEIQIFEKNGNVYTARGNYAKGDPRNPMTEKELNTKLERCFSRRIPKEKANELIRLWSNPNTLSLDILHTFLKIRR